MKRVAILLSLVMFFTVSCEKNELETQQVPNVSSTPCKQEILKSSELSDNVDVEFTNKGVQITHSDFEVSCDFTTVNVTHTFVNGVLNITQQGFPNQVDCICYTDVSYTIDEISQNEVNVIFINGVQVYCYNGNDDCLGNVDLKTGEIMEIKSGEIACNAQYGLSLRVDNVNDSRCPIGGNCVWEGNASVEFQLTTKKGKYKFTLDTHNPPIFKNDTVIEGIKYQLRNVLPYPVHGEDQPIKTVRILVENDEGIDDGYFGATVLGKGLDCGNSFLIAFDEGATGLPSPYRIYYETNLPEKYKINNERIRVKFRDLKEDELYPCTMMGPTYPHIYIVEVK